MINARLIEIFNIHYMMKSIFVNTLIFAASVVGCVDSSLYNDDYPSDQERHKVRTILLALIALSEQENINDWSDDRVKSLLRSVYLPADIGGELDGGFVIWYDNLGLLVHDKNSAQRKGGLKIVDLELDGVWFRGFSDGTALKFEGIEGIHY